MCLLNAVVNPMLNTLGGGGNKGNQLLMFGGSINSIGATITPVLAGILVGNAVSPTISDVNPALFIAMGIFALAFIVLASVKIPEPYIATEENKDAADKHSALSFRHFKLGALAIFMYMGLEIGIPNFVNLYLTETVEAGGMGLTKAIAGAICGIYWFCMMLGRLFGGVVASRFSSKAMIAFVSILGIVLVGGALLLPESVRVTMPTITSELAIDTQEVPLSILLLILTGFCTSVMWGGIFNLAVEGLGKYTSLASGVFMAMVCGGGLLPLVQGAISDATNIMFGFSLLVILYIYTLWYALAGCKNVNTDIKVD